MLSQNKILYQGIGLKRLRQNYWEIRKGLKTRILFQWEKDTVKFILAGNHDDVRRFLKGI